MANVDDSKIDRVISHLDALHEKIDGMKVRQDAMEEEHKKDRADAAEWKARADAERKDREEREAADARRRADAENQSQDENRSKFADAQLRADAAFQAWNLGQAPHSLNGETLSDYRVRLLNKIKQHSKVYKDSNLGILVQDSASFSAVEDAIINDAVAASCDPVSVGPGRLREIETRGPGGHIVRKFVGDPIVAWGPFMGATKFGRINRPRLQQ